MNSAYDLTQKALFSSKTTKSSLSNYPDKDMHAYIQYVSNLGNLQKMDSSKLFYSQRWRKIYGKMFDVS